MLGDTLQLSDPEAMFTMGADGAVALQQPVGTSPVETPVALDEAFGFLSGDEFIINQPGTNLDSASGIPFIKDGTMQSSSCCSNCVMGSPCDGSCGGSCGGGSCGGGGPWETVATPCDDEIRCGPDVTEWLRRQLNDNYDSSNLDDMTSIFGLRSSATFAGRVESIWNFNEYYDFSSDRPECPKNCPNTVTICDECYNASVPEDLNFAAAGSPIFFERTLRIGADTYSLYKHGRLDSQQAQNTFTAGFEMIGWGWEDITRKKMCDVLKKHTGKKSSQIHPVDCTICPIPGPVFFRPKKKGKKK